MMILTLPPPGNRLGPCAGECAHATCREMRRYAGTPCFTCDEPFGYEVPFQVDSTFIASHVVCPGHAPLPVLFRGFTIVGQPGTINGPCAADPCLRFEERSGAPPANHDFCVLARHYAALPCCRCRKPFGTNQPFRYEPAVGDFSHFSCFLQELRTEQTRLEQTRLEGTGE